jgi:two-component system phosphate regulon sensor histidine kinase PhoR
MLIDGEAQDDRSRQEFYQIIQNEANRLSRLIDNMLNISRIEAGIFQVEWVEVDLSALIEEVVEVMTPQAAGKKITLNAKRSALPCRAVADRDMMQQVVTNLVSNAVKYTPEGGRVTVSTELTDCDRSVLVTVADTGLGIPPDAIPKLFEKFYRINNYERIAKGTGLGLNLVKQIVETVHGGEVGVDSQLGMGSKFWFIVPCKR